MLAADPKGQFCRRAPRQSDVLLHLGPHGPGYVIHGIGWDSYTGLGPSPLRGSSGRNPFGAALSSVLAVSRLFLHNLAPPPAPILFNAFDWRKAAAPQGAPPPVLTGIGELWFAGVGSVGSATLYFLTLATRDFSAALFDMDIVKVHNLDRSPVFTADDAKERRNKALAGERFLRSLGVQLVDPQPYALHESPLWLTRPPGRPDVLISAANEFNVRNFIEEGFPPLQLYATTGKHWQVALIRHIPMKDPCSLCLFPNRGPALATQCATATIPDTSSGEPRMDAALPFLSFAAGLMTAAEITKLQHGGYPHSANRVFLQIQPEPTFVPA
jgi:molybdopterin/thiamine biosynthesis adenylyltransferase